MTTYIALFRGINVGGKSVLPMKELVSILEELGCQNVRTYIQSGNAVFEGEENDRSKLSHSLAVEIRKRRGFAPQVLLLTRDELEEAIANDPFPDAKDDPKAMHFGFLASTPKDPDLTMLESLRGASERFRLIDNIFYLHAPDGVGRSRLAANAERVLGVAMTDRNGRTVRSILEVVKGTK